MIYPDQERINGIERSASEAVIHYFLKIRRKVKEEIGVDLLEKSPETLGLMCVAASTEFQSGYVGLKLEGLSRHTFYLGNGDIDYKAALDGAMFGTNDCFIEAVSCFYAMFTDGRKAEQADNLEKLEFASKHHQLFASYFSAFWSVHQRHVNEMAMREVSGDE